MSPKAFQPMVNLAKDFDFSDSLKKLIKDKSALTAFNIMQILIDDQLNDAHEGPMNVKVC